MGEPREKYKHADVLGGSPVVPVSRQVADRFMAQYEHLGSVGLGVWHWGLRLNGDLVAVVSYGTTCFSPQRGWLGETARVAGCKLVQLCRGATAPWSPTGTPSRLIALANRKMCNLKGPLVIVAYADERYGEIGTIYQACNAIYTGFTEPKGQANYIIQGEEISGWNVRKRFGTRDQTLLRRVDPKLHLLKLEPKHRYLMVAGPWGFRRRVRRLLSIHSLPYPKRNTSGPTARSRNQYLPDDALPAYNDGLGCSLTSDSSAP